MYFKSIFKSLPVLVFLICFPCTNGLREHFFKGELFFDRTNENVIFKENSTVKTGWHLQKLNHFDPADTRRWKQRYFVNDEFFKPGGPVFLMIGGEGEASSKWMKDGAWITYARRLNAMCFQLEHRFYGKSHPTEDLSVENLQYLNSQQALADLAGFTVAMKVKFGLPDNKWVAFGGSYPGSLAAWYRMKYPHLVVAAVSTSAPLVAQLNFVEYLEVVTKSIERTNPQCLSEIKKAVKSMEFFLQHRIGWRTLEKHFKLCDKFDGSNTKDVASLFETVAGNFEDIVQYNEDNRAFEGSKTANITINTLCDIMTSNTQKMSPLQRFAAVNDLMLSTFEQNCTDFKYEKSVHKMMNVSWESSVANGERQWTYQTCTEFGFFQSSDSKRQPFGNYFPVENSLRLCKDVYGSKFDSKFVINSIQWSNAYYGGKNLKVSKVIFVNGSIDPWHALGITHKNETTADNAVIFINGTAHCANMYPDAPSDLPELKEARIEIFNLLKQWLQE